MKKDLIPKVVKSRDDTYICFVHKNSKKPNLYYDFLQIREPSLYTPIETPKERMLKEDTIENLTVQTYIEIAMKLKKAKTIYNLHKKRHQYNNTTIEKDKKDLE